MSGSLVIFLFLFLLATGLPIAVSMGIPSALYLMMANIPPSQLIQRILMLEGTPDMVPEALVLGTDVPSMLQADLEVELRVRDALKKGIALCEQHQDYVSREMLVEQLKDTEEDHAHWLEQQLRLIDQVGLKNYLQSQAS